MSHPSDCESVRDDLVELALGTLGGLERSVAARPRAGLQRLQ